MKIRFDKESEVVLQGKKDTRVTYIKGYEMVIAWVNDDLYDSDIIWCHLGDNRYFSVYKQNITKVNE